MTCVAPYKLEITNQLSQLVLQIKDVKILIFNGKSVLQ